MPRGHAKPKPVDTDYFSLQKPSDMTECLEAALEFGYQGAVSAHIDDSGKHWKLILNSPTQDPFEVPLGDVILWDGKQLSVLTASEFKERFV